MKNPETFDLFHANIGTTVVKKSRKPFKSGLKVGTVTGLIDHPYLHVPAYTFLEDDSYVRCSMCVPVDNSLGEVL